MGAEALNATRRALFSRHQPEGSGARMVHRNAQQRETAFRVFTGVAIFVPACDVLREQVETDGRGGQRGRTPGENKATRTAPWGRCAAGKGGEIAEGARRSDRKSFIECGRSAFGAVKRNYLRNVGRGIVVQSTSLTATATWCNPKACTAREVSVPPSPRGRVRAER